MYTFYGANCQSDVLNSLWMMPAGGCRYDGEYWYYSVCSNDNSSVVYYFCSDSSCTSCYNGSYPTTCSNEENEEFSFFGVCAGHGSFTTTTGFSSSSSPSSSSAISSSSAVSGSTGMTGTASADTGSSSHSGTDILESTLHLLVLFLLFTVFGW